MIRIIAIVLVASGTVLAGLAMIQSSSAAEVYVWKDANGVEHWSDRPPSPSKAPKETVKTVTPTFRNQSTAEVPWQAEPAEPEPPLTRKQQENPPQPEPESTATEEESAPATPKTEEQTITEEEPKAPPTLEERRAEAQQARTDAMRQRISGRPIAKKTPPPPDVPKPENLEPNEPTEQTDWMDL